MNKTYIVLGGIGMAALLSIPLALILDNPEKILYFCASKDTASDCVNGVKANLTRCYFDPQNKYSYSVCAEGWQVYKQSLNSTSVGLKPTREGSYTCYPQPIGCEA